MSKKAGFPASEVTAVVFLNDGFQDHSVELAVKTMKTLGDGGEVPMWVDGLWLPIRQAAAEDVPQITAASRLAEAVGIPVRTLNKNNKVTKRLGNLLMQRFGMDSPVLTSSEQSMRDIFECTSMTPTEEQVTLENELRRHGALTFAVNDPAALVPTLALFHYYDNLPTATSWSKT